MIQPSRRPGHGVAVGHLVLEVEVAEVGQRVVEDVDQPVGHVGQRPRCMLRMTSEKRPASTRPTVQTAASAVEVRVEKSRARATTSSRHR